RCVFEKSRMSDPWQQAAPRDLDYDLGHIGALLVVPSSFGSPPRRVRRFPSGWTMADSNR
ncbi:hypothetical protein, partial [Paraburkholderia sediminicola]|uniref:hypothetical protein n=1 Tax=Paraburkholderia sediminicola TaxID=458836 RepID=UPI0038BC454F